MTHHILYRLPEEKVVHELSCAQPVVLHSLHHLGQQPGYIFAPFDLHGSSPILLFVPDAETSWMLPTRFSARHIEYTTDEHHRHTRYRHEFALCHEALVSQHLDKVVLSRGLKLHMDTHLEPDDLHNLFITACHRYPHSYVALISLPTEAWLIATPEILLEEREGTLRTMALAGTMSIEEGGSLLPSQWTAKNREEQRIVADYISARLHDLGIDHSSSAVHTKIAGQLVHLCTDFSMPATPAAIGPIVEALHPTPAVCGLPTAAAASFIQATEGHDRRYYAGFSGPISLLSGTHLFVTLRCMQIAATTAHLYAGGGLLAASQCESEWIETQRKLKTMLNVLQ